MREYGIHVTTIPQSPTVPAFGPGRKHSLLPALAINNTPCCLLNASRPLHKGAFLQIGNLRLREGGHFCTIDKLLATWRV